MYIYSTLSQNIDFGFIVVMGGAGVTNRVSLDTPNGVATSVTSEQFNLLKENESFKSFVKNGYMSHSTFKNNADNVAKDLAKETKSNQKEVKAEVK